MLFNNINNILPHNYKTNNNFLYQITSEYITQIHYKLIV